MSDYTQSTDFSAKDALATGDPSKIIYGADIDAELALVSTAIASKIDDINTLSEDTNPSYALDNLVTFDQSANTHKKIAIPRLAGPISTLAYCIGSTSQAISASTWTEVTCIRTQSLDTADVVSVTGSKNRVYSPSSVYDGYYIMFVRFALTLIAGTTLRFAVTRFNSAGVAQSRRYVETAVDGSTQFMAWGIHSLTNSSGDFIAPEVWSDNTFTIDNSTQNEFVVFKI